MTAFRMLSALLASAALGIPVVTGALAQETLTIANNDSVLIDGTSFKIMPGKAKGDVSAVIKQPGVHELGPNSVVFRSADKLYIMDANPASQAFRVASAGGDPRRFAYDSTGRWVPDPTRPEAYDGGDPRRFAYDSTGRWVPNDPKRPEAYDGGDPRRFAYDSTGRWVPNDPKRPEAYDGGDPRRFAYDSSGRWVPNDPKRPEAYDGGDPRRFAYDSSGRWVPNDPKRPEAYDGGDPRRFAYDPNNPRDPLIYNPAGDRNTVYVNDPDYALYRLKKVFNENWTVAK